MPVHTGTPEGTWTTVANCSDIPTRECPTNDVDHTVEISAVWATGIPDLGDALVVTPSPTPTAPGTGNTVRISLALPIPGEPDLPDSWQIASDWNADAPLTIYLPPSMMPFAAGTPFWYRVEWRNPEECVRTTYLSFPDGLPAAPAATDITVGVTGDADDQQPLTVPGDGSTAALASMAWPAVCPPPDLYVPVGPAACGAPLPVSVTDPVTVTNPPPVVMAQSGSPFAVVAGGDELISSTPSFELVHLHAVVPPGGWVGLAGGYRFVENLGAADIEYGPIILSAPQGRAFPSTEFRAGGGTSAPTTGSIVVWTT